MRKQVLFQRALPVTLQTRCQKVASFWLEVVDSLLGRPINEPASILCVTVVTPWLPPPCRAGSALFGGSQRFAFLAAFRAGGDISHGHCGQDRPKEGKRNVEGTWAELRKRDVGLDGVEFANRKRNPEWWGLEGHQVHQPCQNRFPAVGHQLSPVFVPLLSGCPVLPWEWNVISALDITKGNWFGWKYPNNSRGRLLR